MTRLTLFGGHGFIGRAVEHEALRRGHDVTCQPRDKITPTDGTFGTIIWCIGLTADFRTRPYDTATAHVGLLAQVLRQRAHSRVVFVSSTRVYSGSVTTVEDTALSIRPNDPSDLYNVTKLAGEALVLSAGDADGVAVRLSNVVGPGEAERATFLGAISQQATCGQIALESAFETAKDYLWIDDAARGLVDIAESGQAPIYNLARGAQITHRQWVDALAEQTQCDITIAPDAPNLSFAPIDTTRIRDEFGFAPNDPLDHVAQLLETTHGPTGP